MFRLLVITAPDALPYEPRLLTELLAAGLARLHLRKPGWPAAQLEALIQALPAPFWARLVLHGHPDLVRRYGLGGLYLTASQRAAAWRRPRLLPGQAAAYATGQVTIGQVASRFAVSTSFVEKLLKRQRTSGPPAARPYRRV